MYNIYIRPLQAIDAATSYKWRNNPEIWEFTGSKPDREITLEIEQQWLLKVINDPSCRRFAIIVDEVYVGNIQLTHINGGSAEFHIFIGDKNYWGKSIATLATYQILHFAKFELNLDTVYLSVREDNLPAINSYKKNSFIEEKREDGWVKMNCILQDLIDPMVSVFIMVYNHEKYLQRCLDGILEQKNNFTFDLVVGEDCSTDNSRQILIDYRNKYPGKFKLLLHESNVGPHINQKLVYSNCKGKYMAICEGDDYWTNPDKLQKQVDFLESNPDFNICFHKVKEVNDNDDAVSIVNNPAENTTYSLLDLAKGNFIHTPSVVFRKPFPTLPEWFDYAPIGDYPLLMICASKGKIKYLKEEMAAYRVGAGIWSRQSDLYRIRNTQITLHLLINYFSNDQEVKTMLKNRIDAYNSQYEMIIQNEVFSNITYYAERISFGNAVSLLKKKIINKLKIN